MLVKFLQVLRRKKKRISLARVKRGIVNERCTKWKDRVNGVKFECTFGTTVKKNVSLRTEHVEQSRTTLLAYILENFFYTYQQRTPLVL